MIEGYIYCISNSCMPGIFKIGMTMEDPEKILKDANVPDDWRPPNLYKIEIAKKVVEPHEKEKRIKCMLRNKYVELYGNFFRVQLECVYNLFDLIEGENWSELYSPITADKYIRKYKLHTIGLSKLFHNGQCYRHTIETNNHTWVAFYDSSKNALIHEGKYYTSIFEFVRTHIIEQGSQSSPQPAKKEETLRSHRRLESDKINKQISLSYLSGSIISMKTFLSNITKS